MPIFWYIIIFKAKFKPQLHPNFPSPNYQKATVTISLTHLITSFAFVIGRVDIERTCMYVVLSRVHSIDRQIDKVTRALQFDCLCFDSKKFNRCHAQSTSHCKAEIVRPTTMMAVRSWNCIKYVFP